MRTLDIRGALRRRWYVLLVGTLTTVGLAAGAFVQIGASYELRASALLLPPSVSVVAPGTRELVNPFLRLDGIDPALSVLVTKLMAEDFSNRMLQDAPNADYTVAEDPLSQAPIVVVTASGKDAVDASALLDRVTEQLPGVLDDLQDQAGITPSARITLVPLVRDDKPDRVMGALVRIEILLMGAGLVGTLLLAGLWDAIIRSRAASRRAEDDQDGDHTVTVGRPPAPEATPATRHATPPTARPRKVPRKTKKAARAASRTRPTTDDGQPTSDEVDGSGVTV